MAAIEDIGIDLGTSNVLIYARDRGIVLNEPAVVVMDRETGAVIAFGEEARRMIGRTPPSMTVMRPLRDGNILDEKVAAMLLYHLVTRAIGKRIFVRPRVVISLPMFVKDSESKTIITSLFEAGVRRTQMLLRPLAAAIGARLQVTDTFGNMLVDLGAGNASIAVVSAGQIATEGASPMSGDAFDDAIIQYIRKKYHLLIGERTAEDVKIYLGCAIPRVEQLYMKVSGRNLVTGLPMTQEVTSDEISEALEAPVRELLSHIHTVLERAPSELAADVFDAGITLTGGGAQLAGLDDAVSLSLGLPCHVAEDPQECVARGCGYVLENMNELGAMLGARMR